uniref:dynein axonemal intermediate chain 1-like n=1 Tax=Myxine glutinosa TaxID=7769 RepID=UPI00358F2E41
MVRQLDNAVVAGGVVALRNYGMKERAIARQYGITQVVKASANKPMLQQRQSMTSRLEYLRRNNDRIGNCNWKETTWVINKSTDMKTIGSEQPDAQQDPRFINKFNYNERGSQTFDIPRQERATQVETAPKADFCGTVNKWKIYEACKDEMRKNKNTKERGKAITSSSRDSKTPSSTFVQSDDLSNIKRAAKIIERVVNMNNSEEIAQDYRYFEDASDDFRGTAGTLLPLWSFYNEKVKNMAVTALCWNPHYEDLIVAGYGSCKCATSPSLKLRFH